MFAVFQNSHVFISLTVFCLRNTDLKQTECMWWTGSDVGSYENGTEHSICTRSEYLGCTGDATLTQTPVLQ